MVTVSRKHLFEQKNESLPKPYRAVVISNWGTLGFLTLTLTPNPRKLAWGLKG